MIKYLLFAQVAIHVLLGFVLFLFPGIMLNTSIKEAVNLISVSAILLCVTALFLFMLIHKFEYNAEGKRLVLYVMMYNFVMGLHFYKMYSESTVSILGFLIFVLLAGSMNIGYYFDINKFSKNSEE